MADLRKRVLALVPAYNEEGSIVSAIEDLKAHASDIDYLVVNDGSRDATESICRERGYRMLSLPINLGLTGAFQAGMKYAYEQSYDYVIQFDADGQHSAAYISDLVSCAEGTGADIVVGSRFVNCRKPVSARMVGSTLITAMIKLTTGQRIQDPTSGMRLFSSRVVPLFARDSDFGPEPDTLSYLMRSGFKVCEVPVEMRERIAGESYLNFTKSVLYMLRMGVSILLVLWFRKKGEICSSSCL
ncbi:glycosyltransferase family 2 protein [Gordonibacter sp. Marseille-P4307]|uniref:glycosyltransferase family 2 protein n=1 Tax=Gordonibacter sp. Marseille-P4307 TaxID=2161815 RepID=UPI000F52750C|nr:glycosyltransferase family 2 protein [Gordonibacter sp. Marseille-P4307]